MHYKMKHGPKMVALLCVLTLFVQLFSVLGNPSFISAQIKETDVLIHSMQTQDDFDAVKDEYVPRFNSREDAAGVQSVSYDSSNHAMTFTMKGWYNSSGGKVDITQKAKELINSASALDESVTVGVSAEIKGAGRDGGFGLLKNSDTSLDSTFMDASFKEFRKEMSLDDFKSTYGNVQNLYVGFWSGDPAVSFRNVKLYYYTGEREKAVEMEEATTIPNDATGLFWHEYGNSSSPSASTYQAYKDGSVSASSDGLRYKATSEAETNGVKTDITKYVTTGKSGDRFGASLRIKTEDWKAKGGDASLQVEVVKADNTVRKTYDLAKKGPNADGTNLTNETSSIGEGWMTTLLSGEENIEFENGDKIFLCIKQKNEVQYYNDICLWGYLTAPYSTIKDIKLQKPLLNVDGDKVEFNIENMSADNKSLVFEIQHMKDNKVDSVDEYSLDLVSGTEPMLITLPASNKDVIRIHDDNNNDYVSAYQIGQTAWISSWSSAQLDASGTNLPPDQGLAGNTYRQFIRTSTGGNQLRLTFSNKFGASDLEINKVHIADQVRADSSEIDVSTDTPLTFNGSEKVTIPAGETVTSDPVDYVTTPLQRIAVTTLFGKTPVKTTSHTGARCNNYFSFGDCVSDWFMGASCTRVSWYFLQDLDVTTSDSTEAVACFGDSITDGYGTVPDEYERWTDALAENFQKDKKTSHLTVLNEGIGGNAIFGGLGQAAKDRFDRDVIEKNGVKHLVILIGINDIGGATSLYSSLVEKMKTEYKTMIDKAHAKGIDVYMCTILPFKGNSYYSASEGPSREEMRTDINKWIVSGESGADHVIDLSKALTDANDQEKMASEYANDYLHPNADGYRLIGDLVYKAIAANMTK